MGGDDKDLQVVPACSKRVTEHMPAGTILAENACRRQAPGDLLALLLAIVVTVVVNFSVVCTIAVAVAVIVTVMYALWTHAMTVIIAIDNVDMTRRPIISFCHITDGL